LVPFSQICLAQSTCATSEIVFAGAYSFTSIDENTPMPLIGRTLAHEEGVQLLKDWINSKTDCD
jgi:hypothetical protein